MKKHIIAITVGIILTVGTVSVMAANLEDSKQNYKVNIDTPVESAEAKADLPSNGKIFDSLVHNEYNNEYGLHEYVMKDVHYVSTEEIAEKYFDENCNWSEIERRFDENVVNETYQIDFVYKDFRMLKGINVIPTSVGNLISLDYFENSIYQFVQ